MAEDVVNGAQVNATIYYVLSQGYYIQVWPNKQKIVEKLSFLYSAEGL